MYCLCVRMCLRLCVRACVRLCVRARSNGGHPIPSEGPGQALQGVEETLRYAQALRGVCQASVALAEPEVEPIADHITLANATTTPPSGLREQEKDHKEIEPEKEQEQEDEAVEQEEYPPPPRPPQWLVPDEDPDYIGWGKCIVCNGKNVWIGHRPGEWQRDGHVRGQRHLKRLKHYYNGPPMVRQPRAAGPPPPPESLLPAVDTPVPAQLQQLPREARWEEEWWEGTRWDGTWCDGTWRDAGKGWEHGGRGNNGKLWQRWPKAAKGNGTGWQ